MQPRRLAPILTLLLLLAACSGAASGSEGDDNNTQNNNNAGNNNPANNNPNNPANNNPNNPNNPANNNPNNAAPASPWRGRVVINEVIAAGDPTDQVELLNLTDATVDLAGWLVTDNPEDAASRVALPPETTLPAGGYLVLDINDTTVGFKLGTDEAFALYDSNGALVDLADWDADASPADGSWGRSPDGTGDFQTFAAATPGLPNAAAPPEGPLCGDGTCEAPEDATTCPDDCAATPSWPALVINEVVAAGDPTDLVELYNPTNAPVDLTGWSVTDDPAGAPQQATLGALTIPARGYLVLDIDTATVGFKLGSDEAFALYAPDGTLIDLADWDAGASPAGGAWGRFPDGTGPFQTLALATPGQPNTADAPGPECGDDVCEPPEDATTCPADCLPPETGLVINEIIAAGDPFDQVELYNGDNTPIDLDGWFITDDPAGDPEKATLSNLTIPARGYLLLDIDTTTVGFKLGGDEAFALYAPDGTLIDLADWDAGASPAGGSWARTPDGTGDFQTAAVATPGLPNAE